jgi:hypothetical protein
MTYNFCPPRAGRRRHDAPAGFAAGRRPTMAPRPGFTRFAWRPVWSAGRRSTPHPECARLSQRRADRPIARAVQGGLASPLAPPGAPSFFRAEKGDRLDPGLCKQQGRRSFVGARTCSSRQDTRASAHKSSMRRAQIALCGAPCLRSRPFSLRNPAWRATRLT